MKKKAIAIAAEYTGDVQHLGISKALLHARAQRMVIVFGFDDGHRDAGFVKQDVIGPLLLSAGGELTFYIDAPVGKGEFLQHLKLDIPPAALQRGRDKLGADVAFGKVFFGVI